MNYYSITFTGKELSLLRKYKGITQLDISKRMKVAQPFICAIEKRPKVKGSILGKYLDALNFSLLERLGIALLKMNVFQINEVYKPFWEHLERDIPSMQEKRWKFNK